ncbi:MAG: sulfatase [Planctomycetaceae bacterium]|nr:sulfatase [Planctomycetaceae bacterium]
MKSLFATFLCLACGALPAGETERPNIVFVLADDLGYMDLGCHGSKYYNTPNLDQFAAQAMGFTDAHSAPVCAPTRAALMTGKSPARLHMTCVRLPGVHLVRTLPLSEYTIAELLRDQGYRTAIFGKWQLSKPAKGQLQDYGFQKCVGVSGGTRSHFFPYRLPGLEHGSEGEALADRLTAEACKFMEENKSGPFFVYLSHYAVHTPLQADPKLQRKYEAKPPVGGQNNPVYGAMVEGLDRSVGQLLHKIGELGREERTVVIFTSDNGGLDHFFGGVHVTSNLPLRGEKGMVYEGGVRVPLMIRWPGVTRAGTVCAVPVAVEDYYSTIAEIAGAAIPPEVASCLEGRSIAPLLRGEEVKRDGPIYWHYPHYHDRFPPDPAGAIREGDWKLIEFFQDGRLELYNLAADIGESDSLASQMPDKARDLQRKLAAWREKVGAEMPSRKE